MIPKFRAKANIDNEWIYASNIHKVVLDDTNEELWVMHPKGEKIEHLGDGYVKYRPLVVDEETIGQYTGLKDKNGVEIFEGDIIEYIDGEYSFVGVVKNSIFGLYVRDDKDNYKFEDFADENTMTAEVKILGNIYENKDLLGVENESICYI